MGSVIDAESEHARAVSMRVSSSPLDHITADMKRKLDDTAAKKERCATRQRKYCAALCRVQWGGLNALRAGFRCNPAA
jgi:hypothetical protein